MNAKEEFLNATQGLVVIAAEVFYEENVGYSPSRVAILPINYTDEEWSTFLTNLDFEYDAGGSTQELFGTVWCEKGIWLTRMEYDGSEWWEELQYPKITEDLIR